MKISGNMERDPKRPLTKKDIRKRYHTADGWIESCLEEDVLGAREWLKDKGLGKHIYFPIGMSDIDKHILINDIFEAIDEAFDIK